MSNGLNLDSSAVSKKTILGYAIGIPTVYINKHTSSSSIWELIYLVEPQGVSRFAGAAATAQTPSGIPVDCTPESSFVLLYTEIQNRPEYKESLLTDNPIEAARSVDQGRPNMNEMVKGCTGHWRQ